MQRMADPRYLHTLTMTELFQTAYKSRPPVAEGLLYAEMCIRDRFRIGLEAMILIKSKVSH